MAFKQQGWSPFTKIKKDVIKSDFEQIAKNRARQNKLLQKDLESRGYSFTDSKTTDMKPPTKGSGVTSTRPSTKGGNITSTRPSTKGSGVSTTKPSSTRPRGKSYAKAKPINPTKTSNLAKQKIAKKVTKKVGSRLIPGLGIIALGADIVKEVKSGGAGIKKNIKDVKRFIGMTGDDKKMTKKVGKLKKKKTYLDKQKDLNYPPQSRKK